MVSRPGSRRKLARKRCYREERDPKHPDAGPVFKQWIRHQARSVVDEDKNFTCFCSAPVRSGKSNLSLLAYNIYSGGEMNLDHVGFSIETNMKAFKLASETKGFVLFDEFNLAKRRSMASWNVDLLDMLNAVAGLNLGLWANNPSADTIDRDFIEQGLCQYFVFIYAPRYRFYVFTLKGVRDLLVDHGNLNFMTIKEHGSLYAWLDSYWSEFTHPFWGAYKDRKQSRMLEKVSSMYDKYAVKTYRFAEACRVVGCSDKTLRKHISAMVSDGLLGDDIRSPAGTWQLNDDHISTITDWLKSNNGV